MNEKPEIEVGKLPVITKFIYTLGVLPTSYLMSMTYQEQVTWLYNYLQTQVVPLLNTESAAIQELQTLYELLRTYVNDYFDNLDVQEEINNKLDEMAENGTLQLLLSNFISFVTPELYGAVGDGITDDTQAIIAALQNSNNVQGNKNYKITETINIVNNKQLELNNVIYTGSSYAFTIHGRFNKIKINNFSSDNGGIFTTSLELNTDNFIEWNQLEIGNSLTGKEVLYINANESDIPESLTYYGVQYNIFKFRRCILNENANCNTVHIEATGDYSKVWLNENSFYDSAFLSHRGTVNYACYFKANNVNTVRDNKFYNSSIEGVNDGVYLGDSNINWFGGRFERSSADHLQMFERTGTNAPTSYIFGANDLVSASYGIIVPNDVMKRPYFITYAPFSNTISPRKGTWQKIWATGIYETDAYCEPVEVKLNTSYGSRIDLTDISMSCSPIVIKSEWNQNYINIVVNPNILNLPNKKITEIFSEKDGNVDINVNGTDNVPIVQSIKIIKNSKITLYVSNDNSISYTQEVYDKPLFYSLINSFNGKSSLTVSSILSKISEIYIYTTYSRNNLTLTFTKQIVKRIIDLNTEFTFTDSFTSNTGETTIARWTYNNGAISLNGIRVNGTEIDDYTNVKTTVFYK